MVRMYSRLRLVVLAVLVGVSCFAVTPAYAVKTVALSSGSFSFEVEPGLSGQGEITVINDGDEPIKVLVYIADVATDENGAMTYPLPERTGTPASWFRVFMPTDSKSAGNTPYLELAVDQRVPVKFDFSPPAGTAPGDHNLVMFFEMFDFADNVEGSAVQVAGRIGARIALRVNGEVIEKMVVRPFEVPAFRVGTSVPYRFVVANGGNLNKGIEAWVTLLDRNEKEVASSQVASETTVLARSNLEFSDALDTVSGRIGPHTLEVRVQYSQEDAEFPTEIIEQRTIWLIPVWLLIAVAVLVFVLALWIAVRFTRGSRSRSRDTERSARTARGNSSGDFGERKRLRDERAGQESDNPLKEPRAPGE